MGVATSLSEQKGARSPPTLRCAGREPIGIGTFRQDHAHALFLVGLVVVLEEGIVALLMVSMV